MRETGLSSPLRTLMLLEAVVRDGGHLSVAALARDAGVPVASAHRHIAALVSAGYLVPANYGRHLPGPKLRSLTHLIQDDVVLANTARPLLEKLALRLGCVVQLGILENEMVTYLVKSGQRSDALFTKVGMQLEAYCSGIGKVLLAHLPARTQASYLANGPFVALTDRTITDPLQLKIDLEQAVIQGFAVDDEEVVAGLECIAVPVRNLDGEVIAAISASHPARTDAKRWREQNLPLLQTAAKEIGNRSSQDNGAKPYA